MGVDDIILMEEKVFVLRNLLLKHKHLNAGSHGWKFGLRRNTGSLANLHVNKFFYVNANVKFVAKTEFYLSLIVQSIFEDKLKTSTTSPEQRTLHRRNSTTAKLNDQYGDHVALNIHGDRREDATNHLRDSIHVAV